MNLFQTIFLNVVLLTFPIFIYLIYLSANKNLSKKTKNLYFSLVLITSFFLVKNYGVNTSILIPFLVYNSIIIICYLNDKYILSNIFGILIMLLYKDLFNFIWYLSIMYIFMCIIYLFKDKLKKIIFVESLILISSLSLVVYIYIFNKIYFNKTLFLATVSYIFISNVLCLLYETGERIININNTFKELQKERQIRLSLFKITHEIKNPIAVCKGYLDMINVKDEKQVERFIPIIKGEIERLLSLLQDFLYINKNNLNLDIMDLNMLVEEIANNTQSIMNEKKIKLNLNILDDELYINGDYNRLNQVLVNIIKNSIESIPKEKNGVISISTKKIKNSYQLIIEDNGIGMSDDVMKKFKEPFFTTKKRGSGLGVPLIYEIIDAHSSKINYDSKLGYGTKVIIEFPVYD